jgi:hypothetical protein
MISRLNKFIKSSLFHHDNREGILAKENKRDDSFWNFLLGLGVGIVGYTIFSKLFPPKDVECPICKSPVKPKSPRCPVCKNELVWD